MARGQGVKQSFIKCTSLVLGVGLALGSLISCMSASGSISPGASSEQDAQDTDGAGIEDGAESTSSETINLKSVTAIDIENGGAEISVSELDTSKEYIVAVYAYDEDGGTNAFQVGDGTDGTGSALLANADPTEDLHHNLRLHEASLDPQALLSAPQGIKAATVGQDPALGSQREFKVLSSFSALENYNTVQATLVYKSDNFLAYIDDEDLGQLSGDDLEDLLNDFDEMIPQEEQLFGTRTDVDGDGRFNILFTHHVNALGGRSGGITTGYFYAVDLYSTAYYPQSNETELLYASVPDPQGTYSSMITKEFALSNILPSVLPHEYQHMINFNMHFNVNQGTTELAFLNEGLSHLAEDLNHLDGNGYMSTAGIENASRVYGYLADTDTLCFTCGSSLYQRGGSYLFLRYLYEQAEKGNLTGAANGADLIRNLLDTSLVGVDNIAQATLGAGETPSQMKTLLGRFTLALYLSNLGVISDEQYNFDGIDLRSTQDDNRNTVLSGPAVTEITEFPYTATIAGSSVSYLKISAALVAAHDNLIPLQVAQDSTFHAGAYLLELEPAN